MLLCQPLSVKLIWVPEPTFTNNTKASWSASSKLKPMIAISPAMRAVGAARAGVLVKSNVTISIRISPKLTSFFIYILLLKCIWCLSACAGSADSKLVH